MAEEGASKVLNEGLDSLTKDPKATEDYSKEADEILGKMATLVAAGRVDEAVEEVLLVEKKARNASDAISVARLVCGIVKTYYTQGNMDRVNEYVVLLAKKRGQLKRAVIDMVQMCMGWLDALTNEDVKVTLINTLCQITDGKIFVEVERARLTRILASMKEAAGNLEEAASLMQEVQVETFGAMDRHEKTEFILEQMRLVLLRKDFIRCQIISKKLNPKFLEADDFQEKKLTFYKYMIEYNLSEVDYLGAAKCYLSIFNTTKIHSDEQEWKPILSAYAMYLLLAPFDNEQRDLLEKLNSLQEKKLEKLPVIQSVVTAFLTKEIIPWPMAREAEFKQAPLFTDSPHAGGEKRWTMFHKRVVQHNIRVISGYYSRCDMSHMAEMLGLTKQQVETELSELVSAKFLNAKIDRPANIVKFGVRVDATDRLEEWSVDISKMLDLVDNTCHLIQKEHLVHAARSKLRVK